MVIPISTPAASNKAITLMTSPVAICGKGFSAEERNKQRETGREMSVGLYWQHRWRYLCCRKIY